MEPWFENKLDTKEIRKYTSSRIDKSSFEKISNITRSYSLTTWLIIINIAVFIISFIAIGLTSPEKVFSFMAIQPNAFFSGTFWTLITSMFMHANLTHLFVNMLSLFFIGSFIERLIGRKRLFWLYMISGIVAGLFFVILAYQFGNTELGAKIFGSPEIYAVGASGAIFALGGLLAVLTPNLRVYVFFIIPMKMWTAMIALLFILWFASVGAGLPFGNTAHLGGLLVGLTYGIYLKNKYKRKTAIIRKYFSH